MMLRLTPRTRLTVLAVAFALNCVATPAFSSDMPKRKSGLWEIKMTQEGMPSMGPIQQCIDQNTDNLMQQKARESKQECSVMDTKTTGNKVSSMPCARSKARRQPPTRSSRALSTRPTRAR